VEIEGRVAVVTGGASGIGAAVASQLEAGGARVVVWDLAASDDAIACDVSDAHAVTAAMERTVEQFGPPSLLVTAAGVGGYGLIEALDLDDWHRVLGINLTGTMLCLRAAARSFAPGGGAVTCVSSINASIATPGMAAYCASKAGVEMLVRVAAAELGPRGVRVNAVQPGITDTPLFSDSAGRIPGFREQVSERTPLTGIGSAADVAGAVVALLGADWVTGQVLAADGGLGLAGPYQFDSIL
jgi:NAD(P)-dependent dehydrogenase (short-subunit alcohol dehydrogenase family)